MKPRKIKPEPLDLEVLDVVIDKFRNSIFKNFDTAKFNKDEMIEVVLITIDEIKQRIRNACEFYLRYVGMPHLFREERELELSNKEKEELVDFIDQIDYSDLPDEIEEALNAYNRWLFRIAFKDILGDKQ